ncbi:hypothetical protein OJ253_1842 [Cryptosporidium canis]|uniref:Uncharacterized protein n=1 Tax=Cryptosporidium canis TaxID=195482 RepID=A0A9D5HV68_9CRYT|nr:hypothetical protein OJ253_1842 [Cryptosporidium canis]
MFLKRFISIAVFVAVLLFTQSLLFRDDSSGLIGEHSFLQIPRRSSASENNEPDGCCSRLGKRFRRVFTSLFRRCRCCAPSDEEQTEPEVPEEPINSGISIPHDMTRKARKVVDEVETKEEIERYGRRNHDDPILRFRWAPQQPDGEVPSTSGTSSAAGPSHSVDAGPNLSSSVRLGKINREALELRLSNFYVETLIKAAELTQQGKIPIELGLTKNETKSSGKFSRGCSQSFIRVFEGVLELFGEFLRRYLLDLIIVELGIGLFSAINLNYSSVWIERRGTRDNMKFLSVLVNHWGDKDTPPNGEIKRMML